MGVSVTEKVVLWLKERDWQYTVKELYAAFPDQPHGTLRTLARRVVLRVQNNLPPNSQRLPAKLVPQPPPIEVPSADIPEDFKEIVKLAQYAKRAGLDPRIADIVSYKRTRLQIDREEQQQVRPIVYKRPVCFHAKQHEIVDAITNPNVKLLFVEGAQRSGKSTANFCGIHELVLANTRPIKIILLAGKGGNKGQGGARQILHDMLTDPILKELNDKLITRSQNSSAWWFDGTTIEARDLTTAAIKGSDADIVIIDELDVAIAGGESKRKAVVSAINTMLATEQFKLILTANLDKGIYQILRDEINEFEQDFVKTIQITREDCPHLTRNEVSANTQVARTISDVLLGKGFSDMRIEGIMTTLGDVFDVEGIRDAYDTYALYTAQNELPYLRYLSLDPSGTGHPFGWFLGGYDIRNDVFVEIDCGMLQMGTGKDGVTWTPERIEAFLYDIATKHGIRLFTSESNSGGHQYVIKMKNKGIRAQICQWQGKGALSHESFIKLLSHFIYERKIHLKNPDLKKQLVIYNPERDKEQHKGDIADALLACLWTAVGGISYLKKLRKTREVFNV